MLLKMFVESSK